MTVVNEPSTDERQYVRDTQPYAWPWDGAILPEMLALVIVQAPGTADAADPALAGHWQTQSERMAAAVRSAGGTIIRLVTQSPAVGRPWPLATRPLGRPNSLGLGTIEPDVDVSSAGWDGFFGGPLDGALRHREISHILLSGYWFEIGVHSTMRAANDRGYECLLVEDAVCSYDVELRASALSSIQMSGGIFGAVGMTDAVIEAL